jgi:hypothetical protein
MWVVKMSSLPVRAFFRGGWLVEELEMRELRVVENCVGSSEPEVRLWVRGRLVRWLSFLESGIFTVLRKVWMEGGDVGAGEVNVAD